MSLPSLTDILTIPSQDDVLQQEVLPEVQKRGARVTDWIVGGVYRAMAYVVAAMRVQDRTTLAALGAANFEDYAFGVSAPPADSNGNVIDVTSWAPIIAKQRYGVTQIAATYTKRTITLTNSTSTPYGPLQPGAVIVQFPSGNRYVLDATVTIPANGSVLVSFRSEFVTDSSAGRVYNDAPGSTIVIVTSNYPGVTATNPATAYSTVSQLGSGLGTVTPSGTPSGSHSVAVKIVQTGNVTGATLGWQYQVDGGAWSGTLTSSSASIGSGITVTLADNGGSPAFILGTVYYFTAPGSDITEVGRDIETPQELGTRCRGLWPSLAFAKDSLGNWIPGSPTISAYTALALSANDQVKIAFVVTDGTINNKLLLYIAGQGGAALSAGVLANVQQFFDQYSFDTDLPVVTTPSQRTINLAGITITVKQAQLAAAKATIQRLLQTYLGGVDAAQPLSVNGRIDHAYIVALIRNVAGVVKLDDRDLTINGTAGDLQLPVTPGAFEVANWSEQVSSVFSWTTA